MSTHFAALRSRRITVLVVVVAVVALLVGTGTFFIVRAQQTSAEQANAEQAAKTANKKADTIAADQMKALDSWQAAIAALPLPNPLVADQAPAETNFTSDTVNTLTPQCAAYASYGTSVAALSAPPAMPAMPAMPKGMTTATADYTAAAKRTKTLTEQFQTYQNATASAVASANAMCTWFVDMQRIPIDEHAAEVAWTNHLVPPGTKATSGNEYCNPSSQSKDKADGCLPAKYGGPSLPESASLYAAMTTSIDDQYIAANQTCPDARLQPWCTYETQYRTALKSQVDEPALAALQSSNEDAFYTAIATTPSGYPSADDAKAQMAASFPGLDASANDFVYQASVQVLREMETQVHTVRDAILTPAN